MRVYCAALLFLLLLPTARALAESPAEAGSITGAVTLPDGSPMSGGRLVVFREGSGPAPCPSRYLRPPDETADLDGEGRFSVELPVGRYYLSAVRKNTQDRIGPPGEGDYVYPSPAELEAGQTLVSVQEGKETDIGVVQAVLYRKVLLPVSDQTTAIEGRITDGDGNPVSGAIAFAFTVSAMVGRPLFTSERTGRDGRYLLRVNEGGTYYVRTRTSLVGGHPEEGELVGVYGREAPLPVLVKTGGKTTGIDIQGRRFVNYRKDPAQRKKPF